MTDLLNPLASRAKRTVEITSAFPGSAMPSAVFQHPKSMVLNQKAKSHDVLVLRYEEELKDPTRLLRTGSPVTVTWGTTNVNEAYTWVGYVHTTRPRRVGTTYGQTEIVCVSPSMVLKQAGQQTWVNRPVTSSAADIIVSAGLDAMVDAHPLQDTLLQHGRTYWQVLREIAGLTGYSLTTDNTAVIMRPHKSFYDLYAARARVFSPGEAMDMSAKDTGRTLYSFTPDWSDMSEDDYALHATLTSWAVDPRTGNIQQTSVSYPSDQIAAQRERPVVERFATRASHNISEATQLAGDTLADKRWVNQATLVGLGSPDLTPYRPVYVAGLSEGANGWWQILEVEHEITSRSEYTATMRVGRDGSTITYPMPTSRPVVPDAEVAQRAANQIWGQRQPAFVTTIPSSTGLTGFGDVGGYWVSRRT